MSEFVLTGSDVFGRYCRIEQMRFGVPNEMFLYKVVASLRSNCWCEVPYKTASKEVHHDSIEDCVLAICCGIDETEVLRFRVADIEFVPKPICDRAVQHPSGCDGHEMNPYNIRAELELLKDDVWTAADGCANCQLESYENMLCDCDFEACAYQMTRVICARLDKIIKLTEEIENASRDHSHDA